MALARIRGVSSRPKDFDRHSRQGQPTPAALFWGFVANGVSLGLELTDWVAAVVMRNAAANSGAGYFGLNPFV